MVRLTKTTSSVKGTYSENSVEKFFKHYFDLSEPRIIRGNIENFIEILDTYDFTDNKLAEEAENFVASQFNKLFNPIVFGNEETMHSIASILLGNFKFQPILLRYIISHASKQGHANLINAIRNTNVIYDEQKFVSILFANFQHFDPILQKDFLLILPEILNRNETALLIIENIGLIFESMGEIYSLDLVEQLILCLSTFEAQITSNNIETNESPQSDLSQKVENLLENKILTSLIKIIPQLNLTENEHTLALNLITQYVLSYLKNQSLKSVNVSSSKDGKNNEISFEIPIETINRIERIYNQFYQALCAENKRIFIMTSNNDEQNLNMRNKCFVRIAETFLNLFKTSINVGRFIMQKSAHVYTSSPSSSLHILDLLILVLAQEAGLKPADNIKSLQSDQTEQNTKSNSVGKNVFKTTLWNDFFQFFPNLLERFLDSTELLARQIYLNSKKGDSSSNQHREMENENVSNFDGNFGVYFYVSIMQTKDVANIIKQKCLLALFEAITCTKSIDSTYHLLGLLTHLISSTIPPCCDHNNRLNTHLIDNLFDSSEDGSLLQDYRQKVIDISVKLPLSMYPHLFTLLKCLCHPPKQSKLSSLSQFMRQFDFLGQALNLNITQLCCDDIVLTENLNPTEINNTKSCKLALLNGNNNSYGNSCCFTLYALIQAAYLYVNDYSLSQNEEMDAKQNIASMECFRFLSNLICTDSLSNIHKILILDILTTNEKFNSFFLLEWFNNLLAKYLIMSQSSQTQNNHLLLFELKPRHRKILELALREMTEKNKEKPNKTPLLNPDISNMTINFSPIPKNISNNSFQDHTDTFINLEPIYLFRGIWKHALKANRLDVILPFLGLGVSFKSTVYTELQHIFEIISQEQTLNDVGPTLRDEEGTTFDISQTGIENRKETKNNLEGIQCCLSFLQIASDWYREIINGCCHLSIHLKLKQVLIERLGTLMEIEEYIINALQKYSDQLELYPTFYSLEKVHCEILNTLTLPPAHKKLSLTNNFNHNNHGNKNGLFHTFRDYLQLLECESSHKISGKYVNSKKENNGQSDPLLNITNYLHLIDANSTTHEKDAENTKESKRKQLKSKKLNNKLRKINNDSSLDKKGSNHNLAKEQLRKSLRKLSRPFEIFVFKELFSTDLDLDCKHFDYLLNEYLHMLEMTLPKDATKGNLFLSQEQKKLKLIQNSSKESHQSKCKTLLSQWSEENVCANFIGRLQKSMGAEMTEEESIITYNINLNIVKCMALINKHLSLTEENTSILESLWNGIKSIDKSQLDISMNKREVTYKFFGNLIQNSKSLLFSECVLTFLYDLFELSDHRENPNLTTQSFSTLINVSLQQNYLLRNQMTEDAIPYSHSTQLINSTEQVVNEQFETKNYVKFYFPTGSKPIFEASLVKLLKLKFVTNEPLEVLDELINIQMQDMLNKSLNKENISQTIKHATCSQDIVIYPSMIPHFFPVYFDVLLKECIGLARNLVNLYGHKTKVSNHDLNAFLKTGSEESSQLNAQTLQYPQTFLQSTAVLCKLFLTLIRICKHFPDKHYILHTLRTGRQFVENFYVKLMVELHYILQCFEDSGELADDIRSQIQAIIRGMQEITRYLHMVITHCKTKKDSTLLKHIPPLKKVLETFVYRIQNMFKGGTKSPSLTNSIQFQSLKHRNLQGQEITSQLNGSSS